MSPFSFDKYPHLHYTKATMPRETVLELNQHSTPAYAELHAQLTQKLIRTTKNGQPYLEITLADATGDLTLKIWSNKPWYAQWDRLTEKTFVSVSAEWIKNEFGMDTNAVEIYELSDEQIEALFSSGASQAIQEKDWKNILSIVESIKDPRVGELCKLFLDKQKNRLRRAAAARSYHHARRGGLIEHIAGMMRCAVAIASVYPQLNRDLLLAGVLFHDSGKLWETCYDPEDFSLPYDDRGEMLGHITLGIEFVNKLFNALLASPISENWHTLYPPTEDVRLHILHTIASHHGEIAFGSPVVPKTPEAMALHYIDNLDAKLEMFSSTYAKDEKLSDNLYKRNPPLPAHIFTPLPHFTESHPFAE